MPWTSSYPKAHPRFCHFSNSQVAEVRLASQAGWWSGTTCIRRLVSWASQSRLETSERGVVMKLRNKLFLLCGIMLAASMSLPAQTSRKGSSSFVGIVLDADGKPVSGAGVTCQSSAGFRPRAVHTDARGRFHIAGLHQDNYDLRASANGAYSDWEKNIFLRTSQTREITLYLLNGNTALSGKLPSKRRR